MTIATESTIREYCRTGTVLGVIFIFFSILSVWLIDDKLAFFINSLNLSTSTFLYFITEVSPAYIILIEILLLCCLVFKTSIRNILGLFFLYALVIALANTLKTELKIILARNWPMAYTNDGLHISLLGSNVYGFHFFKPGRWQGSFPSGHTTFISSSSIIMALIFKRYRYIFLGLIPTMMILLLLQNFHFLGDCLSGIALGAFIAYNGYAIYLWLISRYTNKMVV